MSRPDDVAPVSSVGHPGATVVIRTAGPDDATALVALRVVMFEAMGTAPEVLADPAWRLAAHAWFVDRVQAAGVHVVVTKVGGEVISCAVGEVTSLIPGPSAPHGSAGLVSNVATLAGHRGRGHATACTDALLRWFEESTDVSRIDLFATAEGARLYEARRFVRSEYPAMRLRLGRE
ncbi:MAG: GNAT family N-acetyltransferase [Dermatophilaceae bacterium]